MHSSRCSAYRARTPFLSFPRDILQRFSTFQSSCSLRKSYPTVPNSQHISNGICDGIATPKMGHYIQSRLISGSFLFPNDLCFNCDFRFEQFDWGNLIASSIFSPQTFPILTTRSFLVFLDIRALFLEPFQRVSTLSAIFFRRILKVVIEGHGGRLCLLLEYQ